MACHGFRVGDAVEILGGTHKGIQGSIAGSTECFVKVQLSRVNTGQAAAAGEVFVCMYACSFLCKHTHIRTHPYIHAYVFTHAHVYDRR